MLPGGYPDQPANFTNAQYNVGFVCVCKSGYETYYPENQGSSLALNMAPEGHDFCNAEEVS